MNAQAQYEEEEYDNLELAKDLQRQGHSLQCAAEMAWRGANCSCQMESWKNYDRMER